MGVSLATKASRVLFPCPLSSWHFNDMVQIDPSQSNNIAQVVPLVFSDNSKRQSSDYKGYVAFRYPVVQFRFEKLGKETNYSVCPSRSSLTSSGAYIDGMRDCSSLSYRTSPDTSSYYRLFPF